MSKVALVSRSALRTHAARSNCLIEPGKPEETDSGEIPLQSFIVRIWAEDSAGKGEPPHWRGSVQHVQTGEKRYVDDLDEIVTILESHLARLGLRLRATERSWWRKVCRS